MTKFTGIVPAMVTPFKENGEIDFNVLEKHATWLFEQGVSGIAACGSTGEHEALSIDEKIDVYKATVEISKANNGYTIAGMGGAATWDACNLAEAAEKAG